MYQNGIWGISNEAGMSGKTSKSYFFIISFPPDIYFKIYIKLLSIFLLSIFDLFYEMHLMKCAYDFILEANHVCTLLV